MHFDTQHLTPQQNYKLLIGGVVPRPIAWVSTMDKDGRHNLAPYSFFTVASCNPPVLLFTQIFSRESTGKPVKDSLRNVRETQECVVNVVSHAQVEQMNATCAGLPHGESEFETAGIASVPSRTVQPLGVADALVRYECTLREVVTIAQQPGGGAMVLSRNLRTA